MSSTACEFAGLRQSQVHRVFFLCHDQMQRRHTMDQQQHSRTPSQDLSARYTGICRVKRDAGSASLPSTSHLFRAVLIEHAPRLDPSPHLGVGSGCAGRWLHRRRARWVGDSALACLALIAEQGNSRYERCKRVVNCQISVYLNLTSERPRKCVRIGLFFAFLDNISRRSRP